jgi:hypothetical protein
MCQKRRVIPRLYRKGKGFIVWVDRGRAENMMMDIGSAGDK